jgi:hypothetical protein
MKRTLNFWINVVIYALMAFLLFSGLLMKYTMPPGTGEKLSLLGMGRHDWGVWHFWVAVALLCGTALHLYLHWLWIRQTTPCYWGRAWMPIVAALLVVAAVAIATPFVITPATVSGGRESHEGRGLGSRDSTLSTVHENGLPRVGSRENTAETPSSLCEDCAEDCPEAPAGKLDGRGEEKGESSGDRRGQRSRAPDDY